MNVLRFHARRMNLRNGCFQGKYARGFAMSVLETGEFKHCFDVREILLAQLPHARRGRDIIIPIRQSKTTLEEVRVTASWILEALRDPDPEQIPSLKIGVVERVDVGAHSPPKTCAS